MAGDPEKTAHYYPREKLRLQVICVGAGEVTAIPSSVPHAIFTKDTPVKAVDAWSPVMETYKK